MMYWANKVNKKNKKCHASMLMDGYLWKINIITKPVQMKIDKQNKIKKGIFLIKHMIKQLCFKSLN